MNCNKFEKVGLLYFYNELDFQSAQQFKKHLKECKICSKKLKELKNTVDLYKELPKEEPSPIVLEEILKHIAEIHHRKSRKFKIRIPTINIFQKIPCPTFVPRILWGSVGMMIIIVLTGYFSQKPKPYLEWDNRMDNRTELIEEEICDLFEESYGYKEAGVLGDVGKVFVNIENGISELKEKIKNLENELKSEEEFNF